MGEYTRTTHDGKVVSKRTKAILLEAERRLGYPLTVVQGSWNQGVSASAGTHDMDGVVDLTEWDWQSKVRVLRRLGMAAWHRPAGPSWGGHIHAVDLGSRHLAPSAQNQVRDYYAGLNGLANDGPDPHGGPLNPQPVFQYWRFRKVDLSNVSREFRKRWKNKRSIPGVKRIQRALNKKNDAGLHVDGLAGKVTKREYKKFERKMGMENPQSLPRRRSLRRLGRGHFSVKD